MRDLIKEELNASKLKKDRLGDEMDICGEWANRSNNVKLGFWMNSQKGGLSRDIWTKFKNINLTLSSLPKSMCIEPTIIRIFWLKQDIREYQRREFCPHICISGIYFIEQIVYPNEMTKLRNWNVKNLVSDEYRITAEMMKEKNVGTFRIKYTVDIGNNVYIKDLEKENLEIMKYKHKPGISEKAEEKKYNSKDGNWIQDSIEFNDFNKEKKQISFYMNELSNFGILIDRKISFPYNSWYLRCINDHTAVLNIESKYMFLILSTEIKLHL
jgi:hypothetical protein